jgi:hypothetical protein
MSSIETFRSSINKYTDLARTSRFAVFIPESTLSDEAIQLLSLRCEEAELPGRAFATFEHRTYGPFQKFPSLSTYNEMSLTFLCSGNRAGEEASGFREKDLFDLWMKFIQPYKRGEVIKQYMANSEWNFNYKRNYQRDIQILHYDTVGKENRPVTALPFSPSNQFGQTRVTPTEVREVGPPSSGNVLSYGVKLINAFPTSVNQIQLSWGSADAIARVIVTIAYDYWEKINESPPEVEAALRDTMSTQIPRLNANRR